MAELSAHTSVGYEFSAKAIGADGYTLDFGPMDDSFRFWRTAVRWNLHYRHWRALASNVRSLFINVLWRKAWPHS